MDPFRSGSLNSFSQMVGGMLGGSGSAQDPTSSMQLSGQRPDQSRIPTALPPGTGSGGVQRGPSIGSPANAGLLDGSPATIMPMQSVATIVGGGQQPGASPSTIYRGQSAVTMAGGYGQSPSQLSSVSAAHALASYPPDPMAMYAQQSQGSAGQRDRFMLGSGAAQGQFGSQGPSSPGAVQRGMSLASMGSVKSSGGNWEALVQSGMITNCVHVRISGLLDLPRRRTRNGFMRYVVRACENGNEIGATQELGGVASADMDRETIRLGSKGTLRLRAESRMLQLLLEYADGQPIGSCDISRLDPRSARPNKYMPDDGGGNPVNCCVELVLLEGGGWRSAAPAEK